jgi:hypothetical protein
MIKTKIFLQKEENDEVFFIFFGVSGNSFFFQSAETGFD